MTAGSKVRMPCVAGSFYPRDARRLESMVREYMPPAEKRPALAALAPHAGYVYSGPVAGAVFARVEVPRDVVILAFHHRGWGSPVSVWSGGAWETPLGQVAIAQDLAGAVIGECGGLPDEKGHLGEHSAEVQLPFLQAARPDIRMVPVALSVGLDSFDLLCDFGTRLGKLDREFLVVASTDLNHYEAHDVTLEKDQHAIDAIAALDAVQLRKVLVEKDISMCGFAPAIAMIAFAKARGAGEAKLVEHKTSHDFGGDADQTVGYAGMIVEKSS